MYVTLPARYAPHFKPGNQIRERLCAAIATGPTRRIIMQAKSKTSLFGSASVTVTKPTDDLFYSGFEVPPGP